MHLWNKSYNFQNNSGFQIPTNENGWCLSVSFFKAVCKLLSLSRMAFTQSCTCQGDCDICHAYAVGCWAETSAKYVVGNASNNSFTYSLSSG